MTGALTGGLAGSLLWLVPGLPLALAAAFLRQRWHSAAAKLVPWAALPALAASLVAGQETETRLSWVLLGSHLGVDATGRVFLLFTALVWLLAGVYAVSYVSEEGQPSRFFVCYLLAMAGNLGLVVAQDLLTFYLFFALMSFSAYGLVIHTGTAQALRAGRIYIYLVVAGEGCLVAGFLLAVNAAGTLELQTVAATVANAPRRALIVALLVLGFGIKAGAVPLHVWLPLAHPVAPTPASAVLSGAMIKAGLLGWLRLLPLGHAALPEWGVPGIAAGLAAALYGVLVGLTQRDPKTVLAYSSVSQMGLMAAAVALGLAVPAVSPLAQAACLTLALHHALAKGALFLGVGVAGRASGAKSRYFAAFGLLLPALALAGAPFTSGAAAKAALKHAAASALVPMGDWLGAALSATSVATTLLMARFLFLAWPRRSGEGYLEPGLWVPWAALTAAAATVVWLWPDLPAAAKEAVLPAKAWDFAWPVGLGCLMALAGERLGRRALLGLRVPAGDLLAPISWLLRSLPGSRLAGVAAAGRRVWPPPWIRRARSELRNYRVLSKMESYLARWIAVGALFLAIVAIQLLLLR